MWKSIITLVSSNYKAFCSTALQAERQIALNRMQTHSKSFTAALLLCGCHFPFPPIFDDSLSNRCFPLPSKFWHLDVLGFILWLAGWRRDFDALDRPQEGDRLQLPYCHRSVRKSGLAKHLWFLPTPVLHLTQHVLHLRRVFLEQSKDLYSTTFCYYRRHLNIWEAHKQDMQVIPPSPHIHQDLYLPII